MTTTTTTLTAAARVSGTIKADAARLADQAETLAAPLVGQHEALRSHHLETAAALRILAAIQPDPEPQPVATGRGRIVGSTTWTSKPLPEIKSSAGTVSVEAAEALKPFFGDPVMEGLLWSDATPESLVTIRVQKRVYDRARAALRALAGERG